MSRIKAGVALLTLLATASCANGPEVADEAPAAATPVAATPVAATPVAATPLAATKAEATPVAASGVAATLVPIAVIDVNGLIGHQPPPMTCRDILKQGSNMILTRCGTAAEWKLYEQQEAEQARAMVLMLQGFQRGR